MDENNPVVEVSASEECQREVVETFKTGRVPDFEITAVKSDPFAYGDTRGFVLQWESKSAGFGELTFVFGENGEVVCDNEIMSSAFVKAVLARWVDGMRMRWVKIDGKWTHA